MKGRLVESNSERLARIEAGETTVVVGVNRWTGEPRPSPLTAGDRCRMAMTVGFLAVRGRSGSTRHRTPPGLARHSRDDGQAVDAALADAAKPPPHQDGANVSAAPPIACAKAGVTTGEWGGTSCARSIGQYRGPTGVSEKARRTAGLRTAPAAWPISVHAVDAGRRTDYPARSQAVASSCMVGKPGLDGHSNGAEQIAVRATRLRAWKINLRRHPL